MSPMIPDWFKYDMRRKAERLGQWWEDLALRKWANDNPTLIVLIAAVSTVILLAVIIWVSWPEPDVPEVTYDKEWFYDLNTGELFTARKGLKPPIEAPSGPLQPEFASPPVRSGGPAGVRAYVLTNVDEPNEAERYIAFLETSDLDAIPDSSKKTGPGRSGVMRWGRGKLLRRLKDAKWVPGDSLEGQEIFKEAFSPNENNDRPRYFRPK
ncbi:MAG: hypothetical protein JW720_03180 [Sedimentisphaerales bacterium]|nr:hypothetical protein [Sedimentisphaerales bacterium]